MEKQNIIELMRANGISKDIARILIELQTSDELTTKDIMERTGMAQPSVSIAIAWAYKREWVSLKIGRETRLGRPSYRYSLKKGFPEIIGEIVNERSQEIASMMADLKALQEAA